MFPIDIDDLNKTCLNNGSKLEVQVPLDDLVTDIFLVANDDRMISSATKTIFCEPLRYRGQTQLRSTFRDGQYTCFLLKIEHQLRQLGTVLMTPALFTKLEQLIYHKDLKIKGK